MYYVNLQIIPAPQVIPAWAKLVQLPAREGEGIAAPCDRCGGTGAFRHESCRSCAGTGKARYVAALRGTVAPADIPEAEAILDGLTKETHRFQTTIEFRERGGGSTNTGHAQIISGLDGAPLISVHGSAHCNGDHATFFAHAAFVISYSQHRGEGSGTITFVGVDRESRHRLAVEEVKLWAFRDGEEAFECLSPRVRDFNVPEQAVKAAKDKARCYHCRSAYFATGRAAGGSDGALTGAGAAYGGRPSPFKGPGIGY